MRKTLIAALLLVFCGIAAFAQFFDDMPYGNPDYMTYFQQEMTSLMRFQAENDINIPVFGSFSFTSREDMYYTADYIKSLYSDYPRFLDKNKDYLSKFSPGTDDMSFSGGAQIRINKALYIPLFVTFGFTAYGGQVEEYEFVFQGKEYKTPASYGVEHTNFFFGGGAFINTDIVKGGIYLGYAYELTDGSLTVPIQFYMDSPTISVGEDYSGFKIALVPLVNTSGWKYVGKVLDYILGYLGTGNAVLLADDEGDSKIAALASSLNAALDFTFQRIDLGSLGLTAQTIYARGNYDAAAKTNTYGLKIHGLFSGFPFGFTLEGGYKHFYSVAKYFESEYPNTGYFSGSIYFPFKYLSFGLIYKYDSVTQSTVTIGLSTNFLSGFAGLNFPRNYDKEKYYLDGWPTSTNAGGSFGARFRWGGWKVKPKEKEVAVSEVVASNEE
jgi:hypothetical protein